MRGFVPDAQAKASCLGFDCAGRPSQFARDVGDGIADQQIFSPVAPRPFRSMLCAAWSFFAANYQLRPSERDLRGPRIVTRAAFHTSDEERKLRSRGLGVVMRIELSCAECGNNRFTFPLAAMMLRT